MKQQVFKKYKELLSKRLDQLPLLDIGEDSIRYDFFNALSDVENLFPWEIQLEKAISKKTFIERKNEKNNRREKPQLDLVVNTNKLLVCAEFALFRQNSNENSGINKTTRTTKMINDMIRVGLESYFTGKNAYFICVADDKMIGHQLRNKQLGEFPSNYFLDRTKIKKLEEIKTKKFDKRFLNVFYNQKLALKANIFFNEKLTAKNITRETRIIAWEISN